MFASIFFPTLLGMLFNMAFLLTDGIFVGHGIGSYGLASINLIAPIMMLINGLGMMMGLGVSVVAAIHLSKGNNKAARINVTQAFGAGIFIRRADRLGELVLRLVVSFVQMCLADPSFSSSLLPRLQRQAP